MTKKIFISYAHESSKLSDMVLNFSNYLRSRGLDSEIDQYEESPPEGWPKWMLRQIQQADYVLVVCSKLFYERSNDFSGQSDGAGVKWETNLILQQLYNINTNNIKFIPIFFDESSKDYIPLPLQPYTHYFINSLEQKEKLVDRLLGISKSKRPALGSMQDNKGSDVKPLESKERKTMFVSSIIDIELWDKAKWNGLCFIADPSYRTPPMIGFLYLNQEYGEKIFRGLKAEFGEYDSQGELRISLIEKISDKKPFDYKVHFGTNHKPIIDRMEKAGIDKNNSFMLTIGRVHEMNPMNDQNIKMFKKYYKAARTYYITNMELGRDGRLQPNLKNIIRLDKIEFRERKDIFNNKNDPDYVVFSN